MPVPALQKRAPDFRGTAVVNGEFKDISLSDYHGKYLVLFFYPLDFTFVCPTEIIAFSDRADEFEQIGCKLIAASTDSHFSHLAWVNTPRKQGGLGEMNIPLLADKSSKIARDYGVLDEESGIPFRGLFIIDDKQNLRQITINDLPVGRSVDETLRNEAMRLYPILPFLDRMCVQSFQLPPPLPGGQPFTLRPGMNVWIPLAAIGRDPEYFDHPDKFDPDRFFDPARGVKNSGAHFPFGLGQRKCIGERFAMMEMKVLLCYVLAACNVRIGSKTMVPMELEKGVINASVKGGFWLKIEPRKVTYYNSSRVD